MAFWRDHLDRCSVEHGGIEERFGRKYLRMSHPAGMQYEVVETDDTRRPWTTKCISADVASRGFFGAVMSVRSIEDQELFFIDALGFRKVGVDGPFHRFEAAGGGPGSVIDLHHEPTSHRVAGALVRARFTTSLSKLKTMRHSSRRRRTTRSSATPMPRR